ncbi:DUF742 domain-containing protein [Streptomyces sp. 8K308]|uniref:DUF742 domain-containing protein n=1 Tax=Streptomyces sp. 8K308 TaxID=2530388 RepID=UPI00104FC214|nr:DUF742 domain-containing protein [Streptomyces sp. 8K308]TDC23858.1 DUF742 domain-containing protein [Streptomyces sp. 8K308]
MRTPDTGTDAAPGAAVEPPHELPWFDESAGRLIRPFTACGGRTRPTVRLDLLTLVVATGRPIRRRLGPEHAQVLRMCAGQGPTPVAEIAAQVRLPVAVTKVLLADLCELGAVTVNSPVPVGCSLTDRDLLEAVLHGLRARL